MSENSWKTERHLLNTLCRKLGRTRLCDIDNHVIRRYQADRVKSVSPRTVNYELHCLRTLLKAYRLWGPLQEAYKPLKVKTNTPRRALTDEEEKRLFDTAASRPAWQVAFLTAMLAANSALRACEIRGLRLEDVDLAEGAIRVRDSKAASSVPVVPMTFSCRWAVARLLERAQTLGARDPAHFLLPSCRAGQQVDPTKAQKTWRTAWRNLTKQADLVDFNFHSLRHHAITRMAEANVPEQVMLGIAGHVSPVMTRHYSHIRRKAAEEAVAKINSYNPEAAELAPASITVQ